MPVIQNAMSSKVSAGLAIGAPVKIKAPKRVDDAGKAGGNADSSESKSFKDALKEAGKKNGSARPAASTSQKTGKKDKALVKGRAARSNKGEETVEANQAVSEKDEVDAKDAELSGPGEVNPDVVQEAPDDTTEKPETAVDDAGAAVLAQFQVAADAPAVA